MYVLWSFFNPLMPESISSYDEIKFRLRFFLLTLGPFAAEVV